MSTTRQTLSRAVAMVMAMGIPAFTTYGLAHAGTNAERFIAERHVPGGTGQTTVQREQEGDIGRPFAGPAPYERGGLAGDTAPKVGLPTSRWGMAPRDTAKAGANQLTMESGAHEADLLSNEPRAFAAPSSVSENQFGYFGPGALTP